MNSAAQQRKRRSIHQKLFIRKKKGGLPIYASIPRILFVAKMKAKKKSEKIQKKIVQVSYWLANCQNVFFR